MSFPYEVGDYVLLCFMDRSIETWLTNGGTVDPKDSRMHDLSDAMALPCGYPFKGSSGIANSKDVIIKNGAGNNFTELRIKKTGKIQVLNLGAELIKTLSNIVQAIIVGTVATPAGPQPLISPMLPIEADKLKTFVEE